MANYLLKPVFKSVFNREFQPNEFENRLEMQKMVYLLQNMGISVGNYNFLWYKHGPYSQTLQNDILNINSAQNIKIEFSNDAKIAINTLKKALFKDGISYSLSEWTECLGSLYYIKENILPLASSDNEILDELKRRKSHLNHESDNRLALETIRELFA